MPTTIGDGKLHLNSNSTTTSAQSTKIDDLAKEHADVILEVDIVAPVGAGEYGVGCRFSVNSYVASDYGFSLNDRGEARIHEARLEKDSPSPKVESVSGGDWRPVPELRRSGINHIVTVCRNVGNAVSLQFWINDKLVVDVTDSTNPLAVGSLALYAASNTGGSLSVEFDNVKVKNL